LLALPSLVSAVNLNCNDIIIDGQKFDLSPLDGPHAIHYIYESPPTTFNTTFMVDICKPLGKLKGVDKGYQCPVGTRVCATYYEYNHVENKEHISRVIPIAGDYTMSKHAGLDPKITRLKNSDSHADKDKEGLRIELHGGQYPFDSKKGTKEKAIIEFVCDRNRTGLENDEKDERETEERRHDDDSDDGDGDDDDYDPGENQDMSHSLTYQSYNNEDGIETLRLNWRTKYACEDASSSPGSGGGNGAKSDHWGFMTWLIIILFLLIATYLIFGSWLNYNRYGARGWDLVPHGDTIRDLPYIMKDIGRNVVGKLQGGGNRGGYSAV
ncbi:hypothetical protein K490DRAFT_8191, partial [Saccharata proteae CBS 121410]